MDALDPSQATTPEELAECLRHLHVLADKPSLRTLESHTIHAKELLPGTNLERVPLRKSTLSDVLAGRIFPRKAFLLTFVEACGINPGTNSWKLWEQAWEQLAPRYLGQGARGGSELEGQQAGDEAIQATAEIVAAAERRAAEVLAAADSERYQILSQARAAVAEAREAALAAAREEAVRIIAAAERRAADIVHKAERDRDEIRARAKPPVAPPDAWKGTLIAEVITLRYRARDLASAVHSDLQHFRGRVSTVTGATEGLARSLEHDLGQAAELAARHQSNDLASALAVARQRASELIKSIQDVWNPDPDRPYIGSGQSISPMADRLADALAAYPIDASGANLKDLDLTDLEGLTGVVWTDETVWPDAYREGISARSRSLRSGVFQVSPGEGLGVLHRLGRG